MKRLRFILIFCVLAAAGAFGCASKKDLSPVIATVNDSEIRRAAFERFFSLKVGELAGADASDSLKSQLLDEYVRRRLVLDEAARAGLTVSENEIDQAAQDNPRLKGGAAAADAREEFAADLLVQKYYRQVLQRSVRVPPEEIQRYVEQNQARLTQRAGFYVREIRVQSKEDAERLHKEVTEGRRDFGAVARLHSDAPSADRGGLSRYDEGQLPAVLERAIQPLRPGDVSPVIESNFGFHIFKLERRVLPRPIEERRSQLDERRAGLAEELIARKNQQALDQMLERLEAGAAIRINDAALGFTYSGQFRHN
ncbi:MAG TPA: peptidylprolyl isomerase [Blastocatellia bacterium]|nr:peptidylprolyl isomerase [Blastocatellia bacterium]